MTPFRLDGESNRTKALLCSKDKVKSGFQVCFIPVTPSNLVIGDSAGCSGSPLTKPSTCHCAPHPRCGAGRWEWTQHSHQAPLALRPHLWFIGETRSKCFPAAFYFQVAPSPGAQIRNTLHLKTCSHLHRFIPSGLPLSWQVSTFIAPVLFPSAKLPGRDHQLSAQSVALLLACVVLPCSWLAQSCPFLGWPCLEGSISLHLGSKVCGDGWAHQHSNCPSAMLQQGLTQR